MSLNIFLSDEVKKKNPDFSKLLDDVILKYQNSLNTKEESRYWLAKSEWLESHVIFYTTRLILHEMEFKILNNELSEYETKCWRRVIRRFYLSQSPSSLLKKKPPPTFDSNDYKKEFNEGKKLLATALETRLEEIALELTDARDGPEVDENDKIRLARALQIGTILQSDNATLQNNQKQLKDLQLKVINLQNSYNQALRECSDILLKIITKYRMRLQPVKDQAIVKNAITSCDTLTAKLKSIRCELNCETYTPRFLQALKALRTEILDTTKRREIELSDVEQQLEIYRRLGKDFEVIATEYSNVKSDLERQNWTLNEIKKKLNQSV